MPCGTPSVDTVAASQPLISGLIDGQRDISMTNFSQDAHPLLAF